MNVREMTGIVTEINLSPDELWGLLKVNGDDQNEYYLGRFADYIDFDQNLRPPPPSVRELDGHSKLWTNRRVRFKYTITPNGKRLILSWIR